MTVITPQKEPLLRAPTLPRDTPPKGGTLWLSLVLLYGLLLHLPCLGSSPLTSHEVLVAQRTQGLMGEGRWVVPHRNGQPDFNKPALPFWITGLLSLISGEVNEWTVRLPSVAAAIGTSALIVLYVRRILDWRPALLCGWVFLTSAAVFQYSRRAEVDMLLTFWTALAITGLATALREENRRRQVVWSLVFWLATGAAILTKGPLPLAVVLLVLAAFAVFSPERSRLRRILPFVGPLLMMAVLASWGLPVLLNYPQAVSIWTMESVGRFAGELGRHKPFYYYLTSVPALVLPWLLPLVVGWHLAVKRRILDRSQLVILLAWIIAGLAVLSASSGKRAYYALSMVPPLLILAGVGLDHILFGLPGRLPKLQRLLFRLHMLAVPAILAGAVAGAVALPEHAAAIIAIGIVLAFACGLALWLYHANRRMASLLVLASGMAIAQVTGVAAVQTPMSQVVVQEAAIGRYIRQHPDAAVCHFIAAEGAAALDSTATVSFYAGRALPSANGADSLVRWREEHADGLVLVSRADLPAALQVGQWSRALPQAESRWAESDFELLRVPSSPEARGTLNTLAPACGTMEVPNAE